MASADDLGDGLLACSSVYVASAAIGLVLGLVLASVKPANPGSPEKNGC